MVEDVPRSLYKYRSINNNNILYMKEIFIDSLIYYASCSQFNDPFDTKCDLKYGEDIKQQVAYAHEVIREQMPELNYSQRQNMIRKGGFDACQLSIQFQNEIKDNIYSDLSDNYGICCMSTTNKDILMWSHYSDCHTGFCLEFRYELNNEFIASAFEISYSEEYPIIDVYNDDSKTKVRKALLTKAKHWEYEKEWRLIDPINGRGSKKFPPQLLSGVIFGCRMTDDHKALIREWCQGRDIAFYQATEAKGTYSLDIVKLD